ARSPSLLPDPLVLTNGADSSTGAVCLCVSAIDGCRASTTLGALPAALRAHAPAGALACGARRRLPSLARGATNAVALSRGSCRDLRNSHQAGNSGGSRRLEAFRRMQTTPRRSKLAAHVKRVDRDSAH